MTLQIPMRRAPETRHPGEPKRLLLLCTAMGVGGGAEEQVMRLAFEFKARGWKTLLVSMLPPATLPPDFSEHGVPLEHLGMSRAIPDPRGLFRLARLIREFRPDVVHSHLVHANLIARAVRLITPFPVLVSTLHNLTMAGVQHDHTAIFEVAHRWSDGLADRTTTICHAAADYYVQKRAVPASKMMVVPNGIDCQRFAPNPEARRQMREQLGVSNEFVWLAVGRLELQKAYPTMLRAFARLGSGPRKLFICSVGSLREQLVALAAELGIGDRVQFLGLRKDIPALMSAADAFALSSDMEGLPLVLLQAGAAGLPIVSTNVSGNPEVVIDGVNGFLTPPGAPEVFADAMARLEALAPADRAVLGQAGLTLVRDMFEMGPVVTRWERLFEELLTAAGGRARRLVPQVAHVNGQQKLIPSAS